MSSDGVRNIIVGVPPGGADVIVAALAKDLPVEIFELPEVVDDFASIAAIEFLVLPLRVPDLVPRLHEMEQLRVVQVLKAGYDGVEDNLPELAQLCNARGARDVAGVGDGRSFRRLQRSNGRRRSPAPSRVATVVAT